MLHFFHFLHNRNLHLKFRKNLHCVYSSFSRSNREILQLVRFFFTQTAVVMVVTNKRCVFLFITFIILFFSFLFQKITMNLIKIPNSFFLTVSHILTTAAVCSNFYFYLNLYLLSWQQQWDCRAWVPCRNWLVAAVADIELPDLINFQMEQEQIVLSTILIKKKNIDHVELHLINFQMKQVQ